MWILRLLIEELYVIIYAVQLLGLLIDSNQTSIFDNLAQFYTLRYIYRTALKINYRFRCQFYYFSFRYGFPSVFTLNFYAAALWRTLKPKFYFISPVHLNFSLHFTIKFLFFWDVQRIRNRDSCYNISYIYACAKAVDRENRIFNTKKF